jgi:hypothetical protein
MTQGIRRVGPWWIVRGRHGTGFHRYDAMNMTREQALAHAGTLLPTLQDEQVQAMWEMMQGDTVEQAPLRDNQVRIDGVVYTYGLADAPAEAPWCLGGDFMSMPWPMFSRGFTANELRQIADVVALQESREVPRG